MAKRTQQQIEMLGMLLATPAGRAKLMKSLVPALKKRGRVNITSVGKLIAGELNEELAIRAEKILMQAAIDADVLVLDGREPILGRMATVNGNMALLGAKKMHEVEEGDSLKVLDESGEIFFNDVIGRGEGASSYFGQRDFLAPAFKNGWRGELIKKGTYEQDSDSTD
jgi:hypothetical protein